MTKIVPNDLLNPTEKKIKNWNCSFIAVDGPNVLDKISLEDLEIPYESQYRSRIVLKAGEVDQPLIYGFIGKSVTFLMIKVTYPFIEYEETFNISYYFENDTVLKPLNKLMVLTGSIDDRVPQIYLNNDLDYDVILDVMHATIDTEYDETEETNINENFILNSNINSDESGITYSGIISTGVLYDDVEFGDLLYVNTGTTLYKSNASTTDSLPAMYMSLETGASGSTIKIMISGYVNCDKWNFDVNKLLYCSLIDGIMTQDLEDLNVGDYVQVVANAIKEKTIHFNPSYNMFEKQ